REFELQQRVAEYAIRTATVIAAGEFSPRIEPVHFEWGQRIALKSLAGVREGLDKYASELTFSQLCEELHTALLETPGNWLSRRDIDRRFGRRSRYKSLVPQAVSQLLDEGRIEWQERVPHGGGKKSPGYLLVD